MKLYQKIAQTLTAVENCINSGNTEWQAKHEAWLDAIEKKLPSGSGFDSGTTIERDRSTERIVLHTAFHHMDEHGSYDSWTEHDVIVTADLVFGFTLRVTGRDRNGIKEYIGDTFHHVLNQEYREY